MKKRMLLTLLVLLICAVLLQASVPLGIDPLDQVRLRSPGVDAIVYGGRPTYKWYPTEGATVYDVVMRNSHMTVLGNWQKGVGACDPGPYCIYRIPFDLQSSYGTYNWTVRARNTDTGAEGDWATLRYFTYTQLERTHQISPETDYVTSDTTPTLQWANITGATKYLMQFRLPDDTFVFNVVVDDATFCDETTCTWDVTPALASGDYKWHVRAKNGRNFGRWTAYRNITIVENPLLYDFNSGPLDAIWLDPFNHWDLANSATYTGETSAVCPNNCATTIYDQNFTAAKFTVSIRSTGTDADDGYWIYVRSTFDPSGVWTNGYRIKFYRNSGDSAVSIRMLVQSKLNGDQFPTLVDEIGPLAIGVLEDYHPIIMEVSGNSWEVWFNSTLRYSNSSLSPTANSGKFAVDVVGTGSGLHEVDIDWAEVDDDTLP